ncbi:ROK family transcriptional regulator [Paenibacillus glycanilyticus]|uniref:ROK family transcriptional regulator n=1 Tax=Paenibacillus glycanilyticus TaxID=126569 RepID=UPI00203D5E18|nr:ROK family transcriptional regulator [Paenibacillus glycanilyticus]MCM3628857.1 ROK family transcriptional regulator [Paenibacillus glycanilyticus]
MSDLLATPKDMKNVILHGLRSALLALGSATKAELSQKLGISFPTISKFLSLMEEAGELLTVGLDDSSGGRRAQRYAYNPEFMLGLAIFFEKADLSYTIFNCTGEIKEQGSTSSALINEVSSLTMHIEQLIQTYPKVRSIAIGVPGAVNNGKLIHIPDYPNFQHIDLKRQLEEQFALPVVVENDMNAAVLGYYKNSGHSNNPSLVYLYFGQNGPGAGIMINGDVVRGSTFFSGEVSFVPQYDQLNFHQAMKRHAGDSRLDAISRLVASFTAIINPHTIIFNKSEVTAAILERITERSADYIPREHLPLLTASDLTKDYMSGLQSLGLDLMIST